MAKIRRRLPPALAGDTHMVLSIDGGGVRGMIPATVLKVLEEQLNKQDPRANGNARIADYFDLIAGTSTGGILSSLLATPDDHGHLRSAAEICSLYMNLAGQIFKKETDTGIAIEEVASIMEKQLTLDKVSSISFIFDSINKICAFLSGPKYDGKGLRELAQKYLGEKRMSQTATDILLTGFDIHKRHPITFSTYQGKKFPNQDVKIRDATVSTASFPMALPPHYFKDHNIEYNAVDGGVAAANPSMVALTGLIYKNYSSNNMAIEDLIPSKKEGRHPFPAEMLSLGCGQGEKIPYSAQETWSQLQWLYDLKTKEFPMLAFYMEGGPEVTNVQAQLVFQFLNRPSYPNGYLRVEEYELPKKNSSMDDGSNENMEELRQLGEKLIHKNVKIVNPITSETEDVHDATGKVITNQEALKQFAKSLVEERNKRLDRAMCGKKA